MYLIVEGNPHVLLFWWVSKSWNHILPLIAQPDLITIIFKIIKSGYSLNNINYLCDQLKVHS